MQFYRSKIDAWLLAVIAMTIGLCAYFAAREDHITLLSSVSLVFSVILPLWLLLNTRYSLDATQLSVRCGPFRWHIPLSDIHGVAPSRSPLSSPALSLDRLRIDYGNNRHLLISPRHRDRFMRDLNTLRERAIHA